MNRLITACFILGSSLGMTTNSLACSKKSRATTPLLSGDILKVYKTGNIDEAIKKANALTSDDTSMILGEFKDSYDMALEFSKTIGKLRSALILLEKAESLDKKLSGGSGKFHATIRKRLGKVHFVMGVEASMRHDYVEAYRSYHSALGYENKRARQQLKGLERKAKKLYEEAYVIKKTDPKQAAKNLNLVTNMIASEHIYYKKAVKLKNALGQGSQPSKKKDPAAADEHETDKTNKEMVMCNGLYRQKKTQEALGCFKKVLDLEPINCDALIGTGISYVTLGKGESAAKFYKLFIKHCPRDMRAPQIREMLRQYKRDKR